MKHSIHDLIATLLLSGFSCFSSVWASSSTHVRQAPLKSLLRFHDQASYLTPAPNGRYLAYLSGRLQESVHQRKLRIIDLDTGNIVQVCNTAVGAAFSWAPYGYRLVYRQLHSSPQTKEKRATIWVYDTGLQRSKQMQALQKGASWPIVDPITHSMRYLSPQGIHTFKFRYPGRYTAQWRQKLQEHQSGYWLVTHQAVFWQLKGTGAVKEVSTSKVPILSYTISTDGKAISWANKQEEIYISEQGGPAKFIAYGRHVNWHPIRKQLLFSGARITGNTVVGYDLRVRSSQGTLYWLTHTPHSNESWPFWDRSSLKVLTTTDHTDQLYQLQQRSPKHASTYARQAGTR
ncbi:MAG: hypothetical protein OXT67_00360 [Zetaproteobacteria bacterium]|nr:hypothetical protein [Zetaproteobacteria bacterium]